LFYLKLNKDFFDQYYIKILESQPNGDKYVLFLVKLMCESISHNGYLRFNESIPYDESMLASITRTDIDVVRSAIKIFQAMEIIEFTKDKTLFIKGVPLLTTTTTKGAEKKAEQRDKKLLQIEQEWTKGGQMSTIDKSIEYIDNILNDPIEEISNSTHANAHDENENLESYLSSEDEEINDDVLSCLDKTAMALIDKAKEDTDFSFKIFKDWFELMNIKSKEIPSAYFTKVFKEAMAKKQFSKEHQQRLEETVRIAKTPWLDKKD